MSTVAEPQHLAPTARIESRPAAAAYTPPVKIWASIGALMLAVEGFFLIKWVAGSKFTEVPSGPDEPASWMQATLIAGQVFFAAAALFSLWWFLVRPWRREGRLTLDGILCIAFLLASPWDPLSTYGQDWFTYNSWLVNFGSVVGELPGVIGRHTAGAGEALPIIFIPAVYVSAFIWLSVLVCALMRAAKRRRPGLTPVGMIGICLLITMLADVVIEGLAFTPLGFYNFAGGHWLINGGHYYQFPLHEMVLGGAVFATFVCLRYFVNDKGETIAERGLDRIAASPRRKDLLRVLAVIGAVHLGFLFAYHLPTGVLALNSTAWPHDVVKRSYFTNHVCGPEVDRACPGPRTPNPRQHSPYLDYDGKLVQSR